MRDDPGVAERLLTILRPDGAGRDACFGDRDDLGAIVARARRYCVAPSLWLRLRDSGGLADLSEATAAALRADSTRNVLRNARLRQVATTVITALNAEGITPLLLKGAIQLFDPPGGNAGARVMGDLDLLVPPGAAGRGVAVLRALGFRDVPGNWVHAGHHHLPALGDPAHGLEVEIHRAPLHDEPISTADAFFAESSPLRVDGLSARLPSIRHRLLHVAVHAQCDAGLPNPLRRFSKGRYRDVARVDPRPLLEFAELCHFRKAEIDWDSILHESARLRRYRNLVTWAFLAYRLMGAEVPDALWRRGLRPPPGQGRPPDFRRLTEPALLRSRARRAARWALRQVGVEDVVRGRIARRRGGDVPS